MLGIKNILFLFFAVQINSQICVGILNKKQNENKILEEFKKKEKELFSDNQIKERASCIDLLIKQSNSDALDYYLSNLERLGVKLKENLSQYSKIENSKLNNIINKYRYEEKEYQQVVPAFQWAQSLDTVFIEVKFSHRHDSPGCLEVHNFNVDINETAFNLVGYCVLGEIPIKFQLNFDTFDDINTNDSSYSKGSVGRYQVKLKKSKTGYWKQLYKGDYNFYNMRVWLAMKKKFEDELKHFETVDEDAEFKKEYERLQKKYEKRKKAKARKAKRGKKEKKTDL